MAPNDKIQEQILARLATMETYLAQIATAVTAIAMAQGVEYRKPAPAEPPLAPQPETEGLAHIFRPFEAPAEPPPAPQSEPGLFTREFGPFLAPVKPPTMP